MICCNNLQVSLNNKYWCIWSLDAVSTRVSLVGPDSFIQNTLVAAQPACSKERAMTVLSFYHFFAHDIYCMFAWQYNQRLRTDQANLVKKLKQLKLGFSSSLYPLWLSRLTIVFLWEPLMFSIAPDNYLNHIQLIYFLCVIDLVALSFACQSTNKLF